MVNDISFVLWCGFRSAFGPEGVSLAEEYYRLKTAQIEEKNRSRFRLFSYAFFSGRDVRELESEWARSLVLRDWTGFGQRG